MSGLGTFRRRPPPAPAPGPAVLGYAPAKVEGQRVILASCDVAEREDAERDLAEWRKRSHLWQLAEIRIVGEVRPARGTSGAVPGGPCLVTPREARAATGLSTHQGDRTA